MLLLLLAGSTLLGQRERDFSADDGGAGRGERGTGRQDKAKQSMQAQHVNLTDSNILVKSEKHAKLMFSP